MRASDLATLCRLLAAVRGRLRLRLALFAIARCLGAGLLVVLLGLPLAPGAGGTLRDAYLAVAGATVLAAAVLALHALLTPLGDGDVARHVERSAGGSGLGDSLRSSIELSTAPSDRHAPSPALVSLHVAATARIVAALDPRRLVDFRPAGRRFALPAFLTLTLLGVLLAAPGLLPTYLAWLGNRGPTPGLPGTAKATAGFAPVLGGIDLKLRYPAYSGLPERVIAGATGDIVALKGTEVELAARTDVAVATASLRFEPGDPVVLAVKDGKDLGGRFLVLQDQVWVAEFTSGGGAIATDPVRHAVAVEADAVPEVTIDQPAADLEIDETEPVAVAWSARDDYGIGAMSLIVARAAGETREKLDPGAATAAHEHRGQLTWVVRGAPLVPGEELTLTVEAIDNDTVSGPKKGLSRPIRIKVRDAGSVHAETIAALERLLDEAALTLATALTAAPPAADTARAAAEVERGIGQRLQSHVVALDEVLRRLWQDPLASEQSYDVLAGLRLRLDGLEKEQTSFLNREAVALFRPLADAALLGSLTALRDRERVELESAVLQLDDLVGRERAGEVKLLAESILKDQKRLQDLLAELRRSGDPAVKAEIERLMDRMESKMAEMNARLAELGPRLAEEFVNLDALRRELQPGGENALEAMREALARGDAADAEQRARDLAQALSRTMSALDGGARGAEAVAAARREDQLSASLERLRALAGAQAKVVESTDGLKRELSQRRFGGDPSGFFSEARERAAAVVAEGRKAMAALDQIPGVAERRADEARLEELTREVNRRLLESGDLASLEGFREELFGLRSKLSDPQLGEKIEARHALEDGVRLGERTAEALGGKTLGEALRNARPMRAALAEAARAFGSGAGASPGAEPATRAARGADDLVRDLEALDRLARRPLGDGASEEDGARFGELARKEGVLREETAEVGDLIGRAADGRPEVPGDLQQKVSEAGDHMELASRGLQDRAVEEGLRSARAAAERLDQAIAALEQAAGAAGGGSEGSPGGRGKGGGGRAFAFVPSGAKGEPRFRDRSGRPVDRGASGESGASAAKVAIPGAGGAEAPEAFRRDVLEGMKEPRPAGYEEVLDRYFRRLVR